MVMTEWMRSVKEALKTIPKNTPNRLKAAMAKAHLTYKKKDSTSSAVAVEHHGVKKTHRRRRSGKSRKGMRKSKGHKSRRHYKGKGGAMSKLSPSDYEGGQSVGTSGVGVQMNATQKSG
jgi:hypothetical protein